MNGITMEIVKGTDGVNKGYVCPMTQDQYVSRERREITVTQGINPAYAEWISKRAGRFAKGLA